MLTNVLAAHVVEITSGISWTDANDKVYITKALQANRCRNNDLAFLIYKLSHILSYNSIKLYLYSIYL